MSIKSTAIACLITAVITAGAAYKLHSWDVDKINLRDTAAKSVAVSNQSTTDQAQCTKDKDVTDAVSKNYEAQLADLNQQLVNLRMRPATCVAITGLEPARNSTGRSDGAASGRQHADGDVTAHRGGITSSYLEDFAGRCERYRDQVISLQQFENALK